MVDIKSSKIGGMPHLGQVGAEVIPLSKANAKVPLDQFKGEANQSKNNNGAFFSGAFKVFSDGVVFPGNLLDVHDPSNNTKYLRLLAACLGMDELEWHFKSREEEDQQAYIERKEKRRQERITERESGDDEDQETEDSDDSDEDQ